MDKNKYQNRAFYFLLGGLFFTPISAYAAIPLTLTSFVLLILSKPDMKLNLLDKLQIILLGTMLLSSIFGVYKKHSFYATCALLSYVLIYFLAKKLITEKTRIEKFIKTLAVLITIVSLIGILQYISGFSLVYNNIPIIAPSMGKNRITSICYNPLILAALIGFSLPVLISFLIEEKTRKFLWFSIVSGIIAFFLTSSRAPTVVLIFSLSILFFIKKKKLIAFSIPIVITLITILYSPLRVRLIIAFKEGINLNRIISAKAGIKMWKDNSVLTGVGIHNFYLLFEKYSPPEYKKGAHYVHNMYLNFLAEAGILGLSALIAVFGTAIKWSRDNYSRLTENLKENPYQKWLSQGLFVSLIGITIHNILDNTIYVVGLGMLFWTGMGIISGIYSKIN
jgi:putative inorganic carbon (hco3(-)) transporter